MAGMHLHSLQCRSRLQPFPSLGSVTSRAELSSRRIRHSELLSQRSPAHPQLLERHLPWLGPSNPRRQTSVRIGFTVDPRPSVERSAARLLRDAASLLVYQDVLQSPPAQAFLRLLLLLRRSDDELRLLEAFSEFFRLMAAEGHASWQDYLLYRILAANNNPFAEAAAAEAATTAMMHANPEAGSGSATSASRLPSERVDAGSRHSTSPGVSLGASQSAEGLEALGIDGGKASSRAVTSQGGREAALRGRGREGKAASLCAAAASDLRCLQRLAVCESTLTSWVADVIPETVSPEWRKGALDGFTFSPPAPAAADLATPTGAAASTLHETMVASREGGGTTWQQHIGGLWNWGEAAPLLVDCYARNGFGSAAVCTVLEWKSGQFSCADVALSQQAVSDTCALSVHQTLSQDINRVLARHLQGERAPHVLLHGPPGSGKSTLLTSLLLSLALTIHPHLLSLPSNMVSPPSPTSSPGTVTTGSMDRVVSEGEVGQEEGRNGAAAGEAVGGGAGKQVGVEHLRRLRVVLLKKADVKSIAAVLRASRKMPQLRFFLLLDDINVRAGDEVYLALKSALSGPSAVPSNVLLCATSHSPSLIRPAAQSASAAPQVSSASTSPLQPPPSKGEAVFPSGVNEEEASAQALEQRVGEGELGSYFGCALAMPGLSSEEWSRCVEEFLMFNRQEDSERSISTPCFRLADNGKEGFSLTAAKVHSETSVYE